MSYKIAIIIERIEVILGGAERSMLELSTALSAVGHDVTVLAAKGQTNAQNIHILCQDASGKRVWLRSFKKSIREHLAENHYDIIHSSLPLGFADVYQPIGGACGESIIRNAASYEQKLIEAYKKLASRLNIRRILLWRAEKKLCKNQDGPLVAAISKYVARQFKEYHGLDDGRIAVVPNGVRIQRKPDSAAGENLRSQILANLGLGETDNCAFFLFAAHNFRLKGLAPLIHSLAQAQIQRTKREPFLIVAGRGRSFKYRRLARKLNVAERIVFLGTLRHVQDALPIADAAVLPTFYSPCSRFTLEALAYGKPVITTRFNGAADFITDSLYGKIIDSPKDIGGLAQAIVHYCDADNTEKSAKAIEQSNIKEQASVTRAADDFQRLYERIIQRREQQ